ncbi:MAG TPA: hypothetical protein PKM59_13935 [Thermodesulfobacteriota bacterium]|nr:hypothetical protein [Thermodesulfobacteriota bacterium]HNU70859.1 hypothetical protein [Thermodesulfobacteriota bacterium]
MAINKSPWVKNIFGATQPLIMPGKVQAGATAVIKKGEICTYNETAGYFIPANAIADFVYSFAISYEEQKSADLERYIDFIIPRPGDVFEFQLDAARAAAVGDALKLTASDSQKLTYDADGNAVAFIVGFENYPEFGTTLRNLSYAQVMFHAEFSYWNKIAMPAPLKIPIAKTADYTLKLEDNGRIFTNKAAQGAVTLTAPNGTVPVGWHVYIAPMADQVLGFDPKPDTAQVYIKGAAQAAGKLVSVTDIGDFMHLVWDGTDWLCFASINGADADITVES